MGGARDLPLRQQTMRGAIDWSYELLNEEEKKLFRRLSVFVDGFEFEGAEAVCHLVGETEIDILDGIESLVDKSLLRQKETVDGETRFAMFETIKEYGLEQLVNSGEAAKAQRSHAAFFLEFAERAEAELVGVHQDVWLDKVESEHGNLRAAIHWSLENDEAELGVRLAGALWRFWEMRGYVTEGRARLSGLLSLTSKPVPAKARLKALYAGGVLADAQCDYGAARSLFEEQLALNRKLEDKWGIANSLNNLGIEALRQRDYAAARGLYEESLLIWRQLGNDRAAALSLSNLGNVADLLGEHEAARDRYEESLEVFKTLKDQRGVALSLGHMGDVARHQGNHESAR
ncbi:MAG: tetratricopeptide repeat protein, partial [Acidobacteriota bacterium]|nr:tetratricopeptide repeat protein [Acidobacteriota bacterium]